jgi:hypothetical protein
LERDNRFFSPCQRPESLLLAGGVREKGPAAFDQKGVAVRVVGMLSEKDLYRADFLGLDHVLLMEKPVPYSYPLLLAGEDRGRGNISNFSTLCPICITTPTELSK